MLADLLAGTSPFSLLRADEIALLAGTARPLTFGPVERIIVQGQEGDSLFVLAEARSRCCCAATDGTDVAWARARRRRVRRDVAADRRAAQRDRARDRRARSSTRSAGASYEPILAARPAGRRAGRRLMATRLRTQGEALERYDARGLFPAVAGEELQGVSPGGVCAEGLDVLARRRRELFGLRQGDAVLRREDHGGGDARRSGRRR